MNGILSEEPMSAVGSMSDLIGIAHAIEEEAVRRYTRLAAEMDRVGARDTAETFRALADEEREHVGMVSAWAARLGQPVPPSTGFAWRLPADIASSWDEVAGSALLTPYRALAIAVGNEERAFAFYAYIAARTDDPQVAEAAEGMAREELDHAMRLRMSRRRAYHRDRARNARPNRTAVASEEEFLTLVGRLQSDAARQHVAIATALRALGDGTSAALLEDLAASEAGAVGPASTPADIGRPATAVALLHRAKAPLEQIAETCETVATSAPSEALLTAAQKTLGETIARLATISLRAEHLE